MPGYHSHAGKRSIAAAMSQEMVASALSAAFRMAAASASAPPANMVAEMTWKVVSVMSRSIAATAPARAAPAAT